MNVNFTLCYLLKRIINLPQKLLFRLEKKRYGYIAKSAVLAKPDVCTCPSKVFLYEDTNIYTGAKFIISPAGSSGKFIMKRKSGSAEGLTIVTGNHSIEVPINSFMKDNILKRNGDVDRDVVIEEDVWIGANVTILSGVTVGRGAVIGAGSVLRRDVPPYSIVFGNPAKVVSFVFTPEEMIEHEKILYSESERYSYEYLNKNYNKYYLKRLAEIAKFIK